MRYRFALTLFVIFMPFCRLDAQALVGLLGRSDSLQIRGNHDFSEKDIRKALMRSPDFLIAAHPKAPREAFLKATARLTQAGYLAHGHPEARVVATLSEDKENVHIEVHEGPLYYCGPVQVQGAIDIPVDSLVNALSEKPSDPQSDEKLPWEAGEPAPFDEASRKRLHQWVAEKLHALGFFASVVEVEPRVIEDSDKAVLIIRILKEGQKIMLGDIRVEGNHRFSKEDIIRLSGLHEASLLSQKVLEKAKHRLKASQRFLGCQVSSEDAPDEGRGNLLIRVREYDKAPDIGQPWHEKDRIILRAAEWISQANHRGEDLAARLQADRFGVQMRLILSNEGMGFFLENPGAIRLEEAYLGFLLTGQNMVWLSMENQQRWQRHGDYGYHVHSFVTLEGVMDPDAEEKVQFLMGMGAQSKPMAHSQAKKPFTSLLRATLDPVAFHHLIDTDDLMWTRNGAMHVFESDTLRLVVEEGTGAVKQFSIQIPLMEESYPLQLHLNWAAGSLLKMNQELNHGMQAFEDFYEKDRTFSSWVKFMGAQIPSLGNLSEDILLSAEKKQLLTLGLGALARSRLLVPLDTFLQKEDERPNRSFSIPAADPGNKGMMQMMAALVAAYAFEIANDLFPEDSWPWTAMRESVYVLMEKGDHTGQELQRLFDEDQMGPLGYWFLAELLEMAGHPAAGFAARNGTFYMNEASFLRDWDLLIGAHPTLGEGLRDGLMLYRALPPAMRQVAHQVLGESVIRIVQHLEAMNPQEDLMMRLASLVWQNGFQEVLDKQFKDRTAPRPSI